MYLFLENFLDFFFMWKFALFFFLQWSRYVVVLVCDHIFKKIFLSNQLYLSDLYRHVKKLLISYDANVSSF